MARRRCGPGSLLALLLLAVSCQGPRPTPAMPSATPMPTPALTSGPTPGATPGTAASPLLPDLAPYQAGLRPQFAADLAGMAGATRYDLDLTLDTERLFLSGQETIHYTNQETVPLAELYLRLYANYPDCTSWTEVSSVRLRGQAVAPIYAVSRTALLIPLDPPLEPEEDIALELAFVVRVPQQDPCRYRDFGLNDGMLTLAHIYPQVAVYDQEGWNLALGTAYGDLVYADAALYSVTLRLPEGWTVAASGTEVRRTRPTSETEAISWTTGPARDFYLALSEDYVTSTGHYDDVRVTSYYLPDHEAAGRQALETALEALATFEHLFGPYRYREMDVVETATTAGGIEYPGLVVIHSGYYTPDNPTLRMVIVHEVAHQWWYNLVGNDQVEEPWLDEALTTYSTVLFYEEVGEENYATSYLKWTRNRYRRMVEQGLDAPVNLPVVAYSEAQYSAIVYAKGALFFHALREQIGRETFILALQTYYRRHLYGIATGDDLLAVVEEVSGQDVRNLYREMILSGGEVP